jgi:energy-coupling factor transporter ATP-binding protein EcfA2
MGSSRKRGFSVPSTKLAFIEQRMRKLGIQAREALAESAGLSVDVIKKLFAGGNIDRSTVEAIAKALQIEPTAIVAIDEWHRQSKPARSQASTQIDWKQVCRDMLDRHLQSPTLNGLMAKDGVCIDPSSLFVPVGLVERKQKQYRRFDVNSAEQGSQLLQPIEEEIVKRFDHAEEFFTQAICDSDIPNGSRMVITGEPGSGKTTLLEKIGDCLLKEEMLPIWISLGKEGVLLTYESLSHILKKNIQSKDFESLNWDASINELLETGKVWLLLDGADELTVSRYPLRVIGEQLQEVWASKVKVVLTCRLNTWDTDALPKFKVFRTLEFDYQTPVEGCPNQVEAYIHKFFTKDGTASQLSLSLIQELYKSGKERIRDSVKNPLRLSLLCYVWESGIGELPDTKAELYRSFVDYYYELQERKKPGNSIDCSERDKLNLALGEVAKSAFDRDGSRFRLRNSLIESVPQMGKSDTKDSLFNKAIQLGWLNYVGTTAEKPYEDAYAFFHPTFQEYFAALAINDSAYFLNHVSENPNHPNANYRVFESHWKEVSCLWAEQNPSQSNNLIKDLCQFDDNDNGKRIGYYHYTAKVLASILIIHLPYQLEEHITILTEVIKTTLMNHSYVSQHMKSFLYKEDSKFLGESIRSIIVDSFKTFQEPEDLLDPIYALFSLQPYEELNFKLLEEVEAEILRKFPYENWIEDRLGALYAECKPEHFKAISYKGRIEKTVKNMNFTSTLISALEGISERMKYSNQNTKKHNLSNLMQIVMQHSENKDYDFEYMSALEHLTQKILIYEDRDIINCLLEILLIKEPRNWKYDIFMGSTIIRVIRQYPSTVTSLLKNYVNRNEGLKKEIRSLSYYGELLLYELLFLCASNMSYPDFHHIWNNSSANAEVPIDD